MHQLIAIQRNACAIACILALCAFIATASAASSHSDARYASIALPPAFHLFSTSTPSNAVPSQDDASSTQEQFELTHVRRVHFLNLAGETQDAMQQEASSRHITRLQTEVQDEKAWTPSPHVDWAAFDIRAFGQDMRVKLRLNKALYHPHFSVLHFGGAEDGTQIPEHAPDADVKKQFRLTPLANMQAQDVENCHYQGHIEGHPGSMVTMMTCNNELDGYVYTPNGNPSPKSSKGFNVQSTDANEEDDAKPEPLHFYIRSLSTTQADAAKKQVSLSTNALMSGAAAVHSLPDAEHIGDYHVLVRVSDPRLQDERSNRGRGNGNDNDRSERARRKAEWDNAVNELTQNFTDLVINPETLDVIDDNSEEGRRFAREHEDRGNDRNGGGNGNGNGNRNGNGNGRRPGPLSFVPQAISNAFTALKNLVSQDGLDVQMRAVAVPKEQSNGATTATTPLSRLQSLTRQSASSSKTTKFDPLAKWSEDSAHGSPFRVQQFDEFTFVIEYVLVCDSTCWSRWVTNGGKFSPIPKFGWSNHAGRYVNQIDLWYQLNFDVKVVYRGGYTFTANPFTYVSRNPGSLLQGFYNWGNTSPQAVIKGDAYAWMTTNPLNGVLGISAGPILSDSICARNPVPGYTTSTELSKLYNVWYEPLSYSGSLLSLNWMSAAHTAAHELGHSLGMMHDDQYATCGASAEAFIMRTTVSPLSYTFSACSMSVLQGFLGTSSDPLPSAVCLRSFALHEPDTTLGGCGQGYYRDTTMALSLASCKKCHPSCLWCTGPSALQCTRCPQGRALEYGSCPLQENCGAGTFPFFYDPQATSLNPENEPASFVSKHCRPCSEWASTISLECPTGEFRNCQPIDPANNWCEAGPQPMPRAFYDCDPEDVCTPCPGSPDPLPASCSGSTPTGSDPASSSSTGPQL